MNKTEFLNELKITLVKHKVKDFDDIMSEYSQHFDFKLRDGFTEEEIIKKLGDPQAIALQFTEVAIETAASTQRQKMGQKGLIYTGLGFVNIGTALFSIIIFVWIIILGAASLATLGLAGILMFNIEIVSIIPSMPYACAFLFSISLISLSALSAIATIYCVLYTKQFFKAYFRWHKNAVSAIKGRPILPGLSIHPQTKPKFKRRLRNSLIIAIVLTCTFLIIGYAAATIIANAFEWWHVFDWFV